MDSMKIEELIEKLAGVQLAYGNLDVKFFTYDNDLDEDIQHKLDKIELNKTGKFFLQIHLT